MKLTKTLYVLPLSLCFLTMAACSSHNKDNISQSSLQEDAKEHAFIYGGNTKPPSMVPTHPVTIPNITSNDKDNGHGT